MVSFVGAGCGAADLITVRGMRLLQEADLVIYAGSLVNPELLSYTKKGCECLNSAYMTLDEVIDALQKGEEEGKKIGEPGELWVALRTFNQPLQPICVTVNKSDVLITQ